MVRVAPVRIVRRNVRDDRAHGRCRPVDAKTAPTRTWKTAQNAVSHSAHTHHRGIGRQEKKSEAVNRLTHEIPDTPNSRGLKRAKPSAMLRLAEADESR